ncbi:hypothetical protein BD414DRAFT_477490 [Trametes punicea]|nr:hypothetical protein BD414DRAFT_477490 [Trametes punicea]
MRWESLQAKRTNDGLCKIDDREDRNNEVPADARREISCLPTRRCQATNRRQRYTPRGSGGCSAHRTVKEVQQSENHNNVPETSPRSKAGLTGSREERKAREPACRKGVLVPDVVDDLVTGACEAGRPRQSAVWRVA